MDIAKMSIVLGQSKVKQQASLAVMKKVMNQAEGNGDFIQQMMGTQENVHAAHPYLGGNVDISR